MSLDTTLEEIRELVRLEVGRQVAEGQHKLNAKHKAAAHNIERLTAKLKGAREEFDAQKNRARNAEARNKALEKQVAALKAELAPPAEEPEKPALAVDATTVLAAAMMSAGGKK